MSSPFGDQLDLFGQPSRGAFEPDPDSAVDHEGDDAEAVVYLITEANSSPGKCLFVMLRRDAARLCSDPRTRGVGRGGMWAYAFTTHFLDWRDCPDRFRRDDGRMDGLLSELGIVPIWRGA